VRWTLLHSCFPRVWKATAPPVSGRYGRAVAASDVCDETRQRVFRDFTGQTGTLTGDQPDRDAAAGARSYSADGGTCISAGDYT
jgi:hypothetical protein